MMARCPECGRVTVRARTMKRFIGWFSYDRFYCFFKCRDGRIRAAIPCDVRPARMYNGETLTLG
jgi:hypothetical protein